jgi:SAM-dependent methyltransferase
MPDEALWASFFDPEETLNRLGLREVAGDVIEIGCGYGTFTVPMAQRTRGTVFAFDIEDGMVATTLHKAELAGAVNIQGIVRDLVASGTGLADGSAECVLLFNLLHAECPERLLGEAWRVLAAGGVLGITHWRYDASTPRGPSMEIRPRPEQCRDWALAAGFELSNPGIIDLPPYHYGMAMRKPG